MKPVLKLSVRQRLMLLVGVAVAGCVAMAAAGLAGLERTGKSAEVVLNRHLPAVGELSNLRAAVGNLRRFEKDMILHTGDPKALDSYGPRWRKALDTARDALDRLSGHVPAESSADVAALRQGLSAYGKGFESIMARLGRGEFADPTIANQAMEPLKGEIRVLDERVVALNKAIEAAATAEGVAVAQVRTRQLGVLGGALAAVTVMLAALGWSLARSVLRPLGLASAALERLAAGDLSIKPTTSGHDELAQMIRRLAETKDALRSLVQTLQTNAHGVAVASGQIAHGNQDLSERTERQAANLQETAAAMEQLSVTVRQGAEHARQAAALTRRASDKAAAGGEVVNQVVRTMADIQASSRRIADITGVIDNIAFQTNILALNAAVEAARAGEGGRGFAVVAAEVRLLALRSAEAAREIKGLIGSSVERVEAGHALVQAAGDSMGDVVREVHDVDRLVAQLSEAAEQQQQGIQQVTQSVGHLDEATQRNAALVEESAAAADSLRQQADRLNQAAAVFRLEPA